MGLTLTKRPKMRRKLTPTFAVIRKLSQTSHRICPIMIRWKCMGPRPRSAEWLLSLPFPRTGKGTVALSNQSHRSRKEWCKIGSTTNRQTVLWRSATTTHPRRRSRRVVSTRKPSTSDQMDKHMTGTESGFKRQTLASISARRRRPTGSCSTLRNVSSLKSSRSWSLRSDTGCQWQECPSNLGRRSATSSTKKIELS